MKTEMHRERVFLLNLMSRSLGFLVPRVWGTFLLFLLSGIAFGLVSTGVSFVLKLLVDSITALMDNPLEKDEFIGNLILLFSIGAANLYLDTLFDSAAIALDNRSKQGLTGALIEKCQTLKLIRYESVELYDHIQRAEEAVPAVIEVMKIMGFSLFLLSRILSSALYFFSQSPLLACTLIMTSIPILISRFVRGKALFSMHFVKSRKKRILDYYDRTLMDREYFKESRLWGMESCVQNQWEHLHEQVVKEEWQTNRKLLHIHSWMLFLKYLGMTGYFVIAAWLLFHEEISLGLFSMSMSLMGFMQWTIQAFVTQISDAFEKAWSAGNFFHFLDLPAPPVLSLEAPLQEEQVLEIEEVSFQYPFTEKQALKNISFTLKKGETLALVGINGSGKTTLSKLILGLLDPAEGQIRWSQEGRTTSAVFQNFSRYGQTVAENIALGQIERLEDDEAVREIMKQLEIHKEPNQMLGKEWDGTELSGGEWQRIAIARGIFRNHSLIVLDEPTAALDPLYEAGIYRRFKEISSQVTSVIITHRLGAARIADRIFLMQDGSIIEQGSHDELMAMQGEYCRMYESQASWYLHAAEPRTQASRS